MLGSSTITITPRQAVWADGTCTVVNGPAWNAKVAVQPAGPRSVEMLSEGARTRARYVAYVRGTRRINIADTATGHPGDRITWRGEDYVALSIEDYTMHRHGLPHQVIVLAQIGSDEATK